MSAIHFQVSHGRHGATGHHGGVLAALSDRAYRIFGTLHLWIRRTRERDQLARMDDRMLCDIGITRADAFMLSSRPFWKE
jgi:uncharacterized protein YjiS (DUF1127 family)